VPAEALAAAKIDLDHFCRVAALPGLLKNVRFERAYPTPPAPPQPAPMLLRAAVPAPLHGILQSIPFAPPLFFASALQSHPFGAPMFLQAVAPSASPWGSAFAPQLLAAKRAKPALSSDHEMLATEDMDSAEAVDNDDEFCEDNIPPSSVAAAVRPLKEVRRVAASSPNDWMHIQLTDTAPTDNKGSMLCDSLLAAGRVLVTWGFETSSTAAAKTLGRRRWHGERIGIVFERVEFVFEESEAVARIADGAAAAAEGMERPRLMTQRPPRVITVVPRKTLARLAKTGNKGLLCIKVHLADMQGELGDVCCDSTYGAGRVLEA